MMHRDAFVRIRVCNSVYLLSIFGLLASYAATRLQLLIRHQLRASFAIRYAAGKCNNYTTQSPSSLGKRDWRLQFPFAFSERSFDIHITFARKELWLTLMYVLLLHKPYTVKEFIPH